MAPPGVEQRNESSTEGSISLENEKLSDSSSETSEQRLKTQLKEKARSEKAEAIRQACRSRDTDAIISHAVSEGGLLEDELRQEACKSQMEIVYRADSYISQQGLFFCNVTKVYKMMT